MTEPHGWLIDTVPSERFPVYTRLNANDVLPDPITPLGASFCWIPAIIPGWAAGYVALDAFTPSELAREAMAPVAGFFYGHLYVNQSNVRVVGIRAGIGWQAIDAAFFSADSPPHEERPDDVNEELRARRGGGSPGGGAHPGGADHADVPRAGGGAGDRRPGPREPAGPRLHVARRARDVRAL